MGAAKGGRHDVAVGPRHVGEASQGSRGIASASLRAEGPEALDLLLLGDGVDPQDGLCRAARTTGEGRLGGLLEAVEAHDLDVAALDGPETLDVAGNELALDVPALDGRDHSAHGLDALELRPRAREEGGGLGRDDGRPVEDVAVLEDVGLVGDDLLDAQRPLLVPGPRQTEGLVPGGELHGARARVLRQDHREHLEHDALDVVLRLRLGQAQRVDLHAVTKAPELRVGDAVARLHEPVPELGERAHLAALLDEADPRVDEEGDASDDVRKLRRRHLPARARGVEHGEARGYRVRDLLLGRRPGLLQVVAADVGRVEVGDLLGRSTRPCRS